MFGLGGLHPTPRRRRQAVEAAKEVLVYIDERPSTTKRRSDTQRHQTSPGGVTLSNSGTATTATATDASNSCKAANSSTYTPKIRNYGSGSGGGGSDDRQGEDATSIEYLSLPELCRHDNNSNSSTQEEKYGKPACIIPRTASVGNSSHDAGGGGGGASVGSSTVHTLTDDEMDYHEEDYYYDDNNNHGDDSSIHGALEEVYEAAVMKVSFAGGIVTLEYPPPPPEPEKEEQEKNVAANGQENIAAVKARDDSNDSDYGESDIDSDDEDHHPRTALHALPPLPKDNEPPHFELQSTNIHSAEDERLRKKNEIRLAVLDAAANAYKKANMELPDVLLAQINECRSFTLKPRTPASVVGAVVSAVATASTTPSRMSSNVEDPEVMAAGRLEQVPSEPNTPIRRSRTQSSDATSTTVLPPTPAPALENDTNNALETKQKSRVRRLRIGREDEIHVLPCQCAFKLVGMQGLNILGTTLEGGAVGEDQQVISHSLHGPKTPTRRRESLPTSLQHSAPAHLAGRRPLAMSTPVRSNVSQSSGNLGALSMKMAKTPSGQAAATPRSHSTNDAISQVMHHPASPNDGSPPLKLGGPVDHATEAKSPKRHEPSTSFKSMDYHEITLVRKRAARGSMAKEETGEEYVNWDALTIRCKDHDEMDAIISSIKTSARAHVVPFSPDPRAKLKKRKEQEAREKMKRKRKMGRSRRRLHAATSDSSLGAIAIHQTPHDEEDRGLSMTSPLTPPSSERETGRQRSPTSKRKERRERRQGESKKFNKYDYCQSCAFRFTLLTRRHHCRKCDRSCCGDCSSLIIVRGGEEKRFCNKCSSDVIRKQSRDLHRRFSGYAGQASEAILPGKVHNDCRRLGVNVLGKLPHWKNYIAWDSTRRPAVGRITVELIEALALPSIDVSGKSDPYVCATITGYDKDMRFNLKEWSTTFSLSTSYCLGTLAPVWRGSGRKGGELVTLPVISTAGAVLRLEVKHFDHMTHARGRDAILGVVEIPLSDLPNANLRRAESEEQTHKDSKKQKNYYDGYVDRWYRIRLPSRKREGGGFVLSKPIPDPNLPISTGDRDKGGTEGDGKKLKNTNVGLHSLQEIGERFQRLSAAPVEWLGTALRIDVPRRPEAGAQRRSRAAIHVRVKLNANEVGDLLSHTWFPPVEPYPAMPKYDPQLLFQNVVRVSKKLSPYQKRWKFIEDAIKWRHPPKICVLTYTVFALHLALFPYFLYAVHVYLYVFLWTRLRQMKDMKHTLERVDSFDASLFQTESYNEDGAGDDTSRRDGIQASSEAKGELEKSKVNESPILTELSKQANQEVGENEYAKGKGKSKSKTNDNESFSKVDDEVAKLNKAVEWIAKRVGQDRGLETLQFKLGMLGKDLTKLNSIWDGSSVLKTRIAMIVLIISLAFHFRFKHRILWLIGSFSWFFGIQCPASKRAGRSFVGLFSGIAKVIRRKQLHDVEVKRFSKKKLR